MFTAKSRMQAVPVEIDITQAQNDLNLLKTIMHNTGATLDEGLSLMNASKYLREYTEETDQASWSAEDFKDALDKEIDSIVESNKALEQTTLGANAATIATNVLTTAANMAITMLASWAITEVIKMINDYIHRVDKARESLNAFSSEIDGMNNQYKDHQKLVEEASESYDELAKHVNTANNANIDLNDEDYRRFLDMTNELAEAFPELKVGVDDNNNSIINLGNSGERSAEQLKGLLDAEREISNVKITNDLDEKLRDAFTSYEEYTKEKALKEGQLAANTVTQGFDFSVGQIEYDDTDNSASMAAQKYIKEFYSALTEMTYDPKYKGVASTKLSDAAHLVYDSMTQPDGFGKYKFDLSILDIPEEAIVDLQNRMEEAGYTIRETARNQAKLNETEIKAIEAKQETLWVEMRANIGRAMETYQSYKEFDGTGQQLAQALLQSFDSSFLAEAKDKGHFDFLLENIFTPIKNLNLSKHPELAISINEFLDPTISEDKRLELYYQIQQAFDQMGIEIKLTPIVQDQLDEKSLFEKNKTKLTHKEGETTNLSEYRKLESELQRIQEESGMTETETRKLFNDMADGAETVDDVISKMNDRLAETAVEAEKSAKVTRKDMIGSINEMSDGFDVLADVYKDVMDKGDFDFTNLDTKKFKDAFEGLDTEYEEFIETVSKTPNEIEPCKEAFNKLAQAYIDQNGILKDLNEENKEVAIAMLKNVGIINANEIVTQKLAEQNKFLAATGKNIEDATYQEISAFSRECEMTDTTKQYLNEYVLEKVRANSLTIDTQADISALYALCKNLGVAGNALNAFARLKSMALDESLDPETRRFRSEQADQILANQLAKMESSTKVEYGGPKAASSSGGGGGSSDKDTEIDGYEKQIQDLEDEISRLQKIEDDAFRPYGEVKIGAPDSFDTSEFQEALAEEYQKIKDWGLGDFEEAIKNKTIQTKFGNVDMDKRAVINWTNELRQTFNDQLASWNYTPEDGMVDTVFGGVENFGFDNVEIPISFTPIMVDENGGNPQFLSRGTVINYIGNVMDQATAALESSGQTWDNQALYMKMLEIDAAGLNTESISSAGQTVGQTFVHGIISGIDNYTGIGGQSINAEIVSMLTHFSGQFGAIQLAEQGMISGMNGFTMATNEATTRADALAKRVNVLKQELELTNEAYKAYSIEANKYLAQLPKDLQVLAQSGNRSALNKIPKQYQDVYEKAVDWIEKTNKMLEKTRDVHSAIEQAALDRLDLLSSGYDDQITALEHEISMMETQAQIDEYNNGQKNLEIQNQLVAKKEELLALELARATAMEDLLGKEMAENNITANTAAWAEYLAKIRGAQLDAKQVELSVAQLKKEEREDEEDEEESYEQDFDWIERLLERLNKTTEKWTKQAERFFSYWNKNWATNQAIVSGRNEISNQEKAYEYYLKKFNEVELDKNYRNKIINGEINIETVTDEELGENIQKAQDYYSKAEQAQEQIAELYNQERDLIKQKLESITEYFSTLDDYFSSFTSKLESQISAKNASGQRTSITDLLEKYSTQVDSLANEEEALWEYQTGIAKENTRSSAEIQAELDAKTRGFGSSSTAASINEQRQELLDKQAAYDQAVADKKEYTAAANQAKKDKDKATQRYYDELVAEANKIMKENKLTGNEKNILTQLNKEVEAMNSLLTESTYSDVIKEKIAEYQTMQSEYERIVDQINAEKDWIKQTVKDEKDWLAQIKKDDPEYYKAIVSDENKYISDLQKESNQLIKELTAEKKQNTLSGKQKKELETYTKQIAAMDSVGDYGLTRNLADTIAKQKELQDKQDEYDRIMQEVSYKNQEILDKQQEIKDLQVDIQYAQDSEEKKWLQSLKKEAENEKKALEKEKSTLQSQANKTKLNSSQQSLLKSLNQQVDALHEFQNNAMVDEAIASTAQYQQLLENIGNLQSKTSLSNSQQQQLALYLDELNAINQGVAVDKLSDYMQTYEKW